MTGLNKCLDCKYKYKGNEEIPCCACVYNHEVREDFYMKDDTPKTDKDFDLKYKEQEEQKQIDAQESEGEPLDYTDAGVPTGGGLSSADIKEIEEQIKANQIDRINEVIEELEK